MSYSVTKRILAPALILAVGLSLSACTTTKRTADFLPTPPERLICEKAGARPKIPAEYVIDWTHVTTVGQAKIEHEGYVRSVRNREGVVAAYILKLEGVNFVCWNNVQWRREYEADLAKTHPAQ